MSPDVGASATLDYVVGTEHTAAVVGSGDLEVLATPQVIAWCEAATVAAVASQLGSDETTVGTEVQLDHLRPTTVGGAVTARASLVEVDGRRLTFDVEASDDGGQIAAGRVVRAVVDRAPFMERAQGN